MTTKNKIDHVILAAREWILRSNIQADDRTPSLKGSFHAWYDMETGECRYVYPEITGYGITTLFYLDALQGTNKLVDRACLAGDWILRYALDDAGGVSPRDFYDQKNPKEHFSSEKHVLVTFDTGMVICGMAHLYQRTKHPLYLEGAQRMADFLIDQGQKSDGLFNACYEPATRLWSDTAHKWSTQSGSYHAKLALGFVVLYQATGNEKYKLATERICNASLKLQDVSGRFVTFRHGEHAGKNSGGTHMHPHLYSAEGLIVAGVAFNRPDYIKSAGRAAQWVLKQQLPDGGVPCIVYESGEPNPNQRSDTLGQALRMASLCYGLGELPDSYLPQLAKLHDKILTYQYADSKNSDKEYSRGGFAYGFEADGTQRKHLNFWCTAFILQGLASYKNEVLEKSQVSLDNPDLNFLI